MDRYQEALRLNNQAIHLVATTPAVSDVDTSSAVQLLSKAVSILKQDVLKDQLSQNTNGNGNTTAIGFDSVNLDPSPSHQHTHMKGESCDGCDDCFQYAIVFTTAASERSLDVRVITSMVVFNLALIYHRQAIKMKLATNTLTVTKAYRLYGLALRIFEDLSIEMNHGSIFVMLASMNNQRSMIRQDSAGHVQVNHQAFVQRIIATTRQTGVSIASDYVFEQSPELQGLLFNVVLGMQESKVAPAA